MCSTIHVFMIVLMVQSGLAIKCFNCDSDSNEGCANMTDVNLIAEECDDDKQMELESQFETYNRLWLLKISDIHYHRGAKGKSDSIKMVCQKIVGIDEYQRKSVVRRCQLANVNCDYSEQQKAVQKLKNAQIEVCEFCDDKDACNGSPSNRVFGVAVIGGAVGMLTACRHFIL